MKKIEMFSPIKEEAGVVMAFAKLHEDLGFPKLVPSSSHGFDIEDIEYKGKRVTVEFEYVSKNYIEHGHVEKMKDGRDYIVICYEDNCNLIKTVREQFNKTNLQIIELKNYIEFKPDVIKENENNIQYYVLSYNPVMAENKSIVEWKNTNVYGINAQFANNYIVPGSKILFKQGDYIVAECSVVRYEKFDKPKTENEWKLYKNIINYPLGIFNCTQEELEKEFTKGFIFYDEFTLFTERRVSFKKTLPDKKMGHQGMIIITKAEYDKLTGN